ncbi:plasmalemma vesicle associated protein b [Cololabis saira]|uniref:plasmalemma vesicle associated protein b n=1 Tax=Cololabis saira TaxID=129043 RepID=UPI002AD592DD|nr:plasmalemma vesicle associated protein b [Cololabis saira]
MYSSNYSRAKFGLEAKERLQKSRGKSCGYYMRIVFLFSSLIQSLIIVSLVLFLIYGQPEKSAQEKMVKELQLGYNRLSENNIQLTKEKGELGAQLEARASEKAALEKEMAKQGEASNKTVQDLKIKLNVCQSMVSMVQRTAQAPVRSLPPVTSNNELKTLQTRNAQLEAKMNLINTNFTQRVQYLTQERDDAVRDRDVHLEDAVKLRRDNTLLSQQISTFTRKCKEDFVHSLDGIQTVTRDFLNRINNLFPHQMTFYLTCNGQREQMETIRNSCTNLSREVENKFQLYLDNVGNKVAEIQSLSSEQEVLNSHLKSEVSQCKNDKTEIATKAAKDLEIKQKTHDNRVENLLVEQNRLRDEKKVQEETLALKQKELLALRGLLPNNKVGPPAGLRDAGKLQR